MPTSWYVCPYDWVVENGEGFRRPGISRYFPTIPNPEGVTWDEAEILNNHIIVKVIGPDTAHTTLRADPDFREIPIDQVVLRPALRNAIRNRLEVLGYTTQEIDDTNFVVTQILALLTTAAGNFRLNATGDGIEILPGRRVAPKTVSQIESRLPG